MSSQQTSDNLPHNPNLNSSAKSLYKQTIRNKDQIINTLNNQLHQIVIQQQQLITTITKLQENIVQVDLKQLDNSLMNQQQKILMIDVSQVVNDQEHDHVMKMDARVKIVKEVFDQHSHKRSDMFQGYYNQLLHKNTQILQQLEDKSKEHESFMAQIKKQIQQNQEYVHSEFLTKLKQVQTQNQVMLSQNQSLKVSNKEYSQLAKEATKNRQLAYQYNIKLIELTNTKNQLQQTLKLTSIKLKSQISKYKQYQQQTTKQLQIKNNIIRRYVNDTKDDYSHNSEDQKEIQMHIFKEECQMKVKEIEKRKDKEIVGLKQKIENLNQKVNNQNVVVETDRITIEHLKRKYQLLLKEFEKYKAKDQKDALKIHQSQSYSPKHHSIGKDNTSPTNFKTTKIKSRIMREKELLKGKKRIRLGF